MNLQKKNDKPAQEIKSHTLSKSQMELYSIDWLAELPYGKNKGKSVQWVKNNDESYWKWMVKEEMVYKWFLIKLKSDAVGSSPKKKYSNFLSESTGEYWVELREVPGTGKRSEWL